MSYTIDTSGPTKQSKEFKVMCQKDIKSDIELHEFVTKMLAEGFYYDKIKEGYIYAEYGRTIQKHGSPYGMNL